MWQRKYELSFTEEDINERKVKFCETETLYDPKIVDFYSETELYGIANLNLEDLGKYTNEGV